MGAFGGDDLEQTNKQIIAGVHNALEAAYQEPSVKRFVLTTSAGNAAMAEFGYESLTVQADSWNSKVYQWLEKEDADPVTTFMARYVISRIEAEKAAWDYVEAHKAERPDLVFNTGKIGPLPSKSQFSNY